MYKTGIITVIIFVGLFFVTGCENDAQTGSLLGAGIGAGVGALAGGSTEATLIGAGIGGGAGYLIGNEQDKKKQSAKTDAQMAQLRHEMNTETVNVTCSNDSIIQVKLHKQGTGYVGPKGEFYSTLPTEAQLLPVYGF